MLVLIFVVIFASLLIPGDALYKPKGPVTVVMDDKQFKDEVLKHNGVVFVEFYAPWCGHCKNLVPEYEKAASHLAGVVKVVAVDATVAQSVAQKYQVQGYPTLKVFGADKKSPIDYQGQRTTDAIVSESMKQVNKLVKDRKAGKTKGSSSSSESKKGSKKSKKGGSDVVQLTDANFEKTVMQSKDHWLVEFYAPWCGHCKNLAPEWEEAATMLKSQGVKLGAVDATAEQRLAQTYGIKGFPTIKVFTAGPKGEPVDYNGPREAAGIIDYAVQSLESANVPISVDQLLSQSGYDEAAGRSKILGVLFLPHILDSGAEKRNKYVEVLAEVAKQFRKMPFTWIWTEAHAQPGLESALNINENYPTLALISVEKNVFSTPKLSWSYDNIKSFVQNTLSGIEKTSAISGEFKIQNVEAWDGKDMVLEVDEISLDDLDL